MSQPTVMARADWNSRLNIPHNVNRVYNIESNRYMRHTNTALYHNERKNPHAQELYCGGLKSIWRDGDANKSYYKPNEVTESCRWPHRDFDCPIDPTTGYVSVAGEIDRNTGVHSIPDCNTLEQKPQEVTPSDPIPKARVLTTPRTRTPSDLDRYGKALDCNTKWSSRRKTDGMKIGELTGWVGTNEVAKEKLLTPIKPEVTALLASRGLAMDGYRQQELAKAYRWTSATQTAWDQVPWDDMLAPKRCPPVSTKEFHTDPVREFGTGVREEVNMDYQKLGNTWDKAQTRRGHYGKLPHDFTSPFNHRGRQMSSYSGCFGTAEDPDDKDNPYVRYDPLTVVRNPAPKTPFMYHGEQIPGYTGKWVTRADAARRAAASAAQTTSAIAHGEKPAVVFDGTNQHQSPLSKTTTTVEPGNPFKLDSN